MEEKSQGDRSSRRVYADVHSKAAPRSSTDRLEHLLALVQASAGKEWSATKWGSRLTAGGAVRLSESSLILARRKGMQELPFLNMAYLEVDKGLIWSSIKIKMENSAADVTVAGFRREDAAEAFAAVNRSWTLANVRALQKYLPRAKDIAARVAQAFEKAAWIPTSQAHQVYRSVASKSGREAADWPRYAEDAGALDYFLDEHVAALKLMLDPFVEISEHVVPHNERFLEDELTARKAFFDTIEKNTLTDEQRVAAI